MAVSVDNPGQGTPITTESQISEEVKQLGNVTGNIKRAIGDLLTAGENLNKAFIGTRARMDEFLVRIQDASPALKALGATTEQIQATIAQIASGSRRQLVASTEDIKELFSASEILDQKVGDIVENFGKAGYNYQEIGKNLINGINLVRNYGLNAQTVMAEVVKNTDQLSRFNFQNGVQGLTRMAAQASMLRFDMNQTFQLAERVLDPDQAVSVASAFQRLGVAAGNLVDPLALLNQSLTDPSGLQDSLINVARQFTYFDESTKSFKINPQGILTLREMEAQTGVSAKTMREAALAAADLDRRLAEIDKTGVAINMPKDDKTLLANISRMGDKGVMEVKISKPGEKEQYVELSKLTSDQIKNLLEEQKRAPQTLEDLQRAQLTTSEKTLAEFRKLNQNMANALLGGPGFVGFLQKTTDNIRGSLEKLDMQVLGDRFQEAFSDLYQEAEGKPLEERAEVFSKISGRILEKFGDITENVGSTISRTFEGTAAQDFINQYTSFLPGLTLPIGRGDETEGFRVPEKPPRGATQPPPRSRAVYGYEEMRTNNTINLSELMSKITSIQKPPITVNQTNNYTQTNTEVTQPFAKDFFQNLGRQDIEKLKKMLEEVQNATGQ